MLVTTKGGMNNAFAFVHDLCANPKHSRWICPLLLLGDIFLCALIIWRIPYTNIDWSTYMQQVSLVLSGERDYTAIKGSTGPLVYPAGHVYIYSLLHGLTDGGQNLLLGQGIFAILYLATLSIVMACYRSVNAPPYIFPLLMLSKRLHSVFLLRLFNDGFATFFLWGATYLLLKRQWARAVIVWSAGVSVKMTLLLVAPALAVILIFAVGFWNGIGLGAIALLLQGSVAAPFLQENAQGYFTRAFEFTRQFLFLWTVNWRFIGEDIFLSRSFSVFLLITHGALLLVFLNFSWIRPSNRPLGKFIQDALRGNTRYPISNSFIVTTMMSSMVVGLLCARSLHYQFFAYLAWASPLLLWKSGLNPVLIYLVWAAQEWAWNVYPSTTASSITVIVCLSTQVIGVIWNRGGVEHQVRRGVKKEHAQ